MENNKYSLSTTMGMIIGIVIGSGIFFKSDNILISTNGSIIIGVIIFCLAAISIIFGSLSIAELASRNDNSGGIIAYAEQYCGKSTACAFGWFQFFLYYPTLIAIVGYVSGVYLCILFNIKSTLLLEILIGSLFIIFLFITNIVSKQLGGYLQNISTIIKLISLIFIAIAGLAFGNPSYIDVGSYKSFSSFSLLTAIAPVAFSFDGWIIATSISHEIDNPKKNLPKALIFCPIIILLSYIAYFVGISIYLGPEKIMSLGDAHVAYAATKLLGHFGAKIVLIFVIISILGTLNGLIIGIIRLPQALSERGMFPKSEVFVKLNDKYGISISSAVIGLLVSLGWLFIHYITQRFDLLPNSDVSEISITFNYVAYIILYIQVIKLAKAKQIDSIVKGYINPILAILGSIMILLGCIGNTLFIYYFIGCLGLILCAFRFWNKSNYDEPLTMDDECFSIDD